MHLLKTLTLLFTAFILGCSQDEPNNVTSSTDGSTLTINGQESGVGDGVTAEGQQIAEGYGMTYSSTAHDESIPALPIFGFANGQPFNAGTVVFREDHKGLWHLEISDRSFEPINGLALARSNNPGIQTAFIMLAEQPQSGKTYTRSMSYGDGYFQIGQTPGASTTTSWNTSFTFKLIIDKWDKGPSMTTSCGTPALGSASGRIFVAYQGSSEPGRIKNSWLSGQFTDAPILYCPQ